MTNLQEAKLAREAEICYATLAMVTDYDCWHPEHDSRHRRAGGGGARRERGQGAGRAESGGPPHRRGPRDCPCAHALKNALMTAPALVPETVKKELAPHRRQVPQKGW